MATKTGKKLATAKSKKRRSSDQSMIKQAEVAASEPANVDQSFNEDLGESEFMPSEESAFRVDPVLSRTSFLIEDYRRFKASRTIQTAFRGWFVRRKLKQEREAALAIQTEWRRFNAQRYYYQLLEDTIQKRVEEHFFNAATKIQSLFRGFWVRENIHDHYRLQRAQMAEAEDLLQCVAFKLHHLLRTHQIPGIYSLRNSYCLSKVEKLLASISMKQSNDRVRAAYARRQHQLHEAKKLFKKSTHCTNVPFPGPNLYGACDPKCQAFFKEKDLDRKMHNILEQYMETARAEGKKRAAQKKEAKKKKGRDFCEDIVASMKRWNILTTNNLSVDPNIFHTPEKVEKFLSEIRSMYDMMQDRCHCKRNTEEIMACPAPYSDKFECP